jgi:Na+/melibiose symporter-like transporter
VRSLGWVLGVIAWLLATDARPWLALFSLLAAVVIRAIYVITTPWGRGRSVFWSAWFFVVAAACELVWLAWSSLT